MTRSILCSRGQPHIPLTIPPPPGGIFRVASCHLLEPKLCIRYDLVIIVTNTDPALVRQAVSPISTDLNIRLWDAAVADQEPEAKDGLGENIKDSIGENLRVDGRLAGTVGEAPNTNTAVSLTSMIVEVVSGSAHMG